MYISQIKRQTLNQTVALRMACDQGLSGRSDEWEINVTIVRSTTHESTMCIVMPRYAPVVAHVTSSLLGVVIWLLMASALEDAVR